MASGDLHQILCEAIRNRQILRFKYHGGDRVVEPYLYGVTREGKEMLSAFQLTGESRSGRPFHWKLFDVSQMKEVRPSEKMFKGERPGYTGETKRLAGVFCCVFEEEAGLS